MGYSAIKYHDMFIVRYNQIHHSVCKKKKVVLYIHLTGHYYQPKISFSAHELA